MARLEALKVESLSRFYGGVRALNRVTLALEKGERRGIIGPNGAGKTTLFRLIAGETKPSRGRVLLNGDDITGLDPEIISGRGLARTFQHNNLFVNLPVYENVLLGVLSRKRLRWRPVGRGSGYKDLRQDAEHVLQETKLLSRWNTPAGHLSYGEQRQLEVAIALATKPSVLLVDEPTAGMSPAETAGMVELLQELPREITLAVIEHDTRVVFSLAETITVLHLGEVIAEGRAGDIRNDAEVNRVYFAGGATGA